MAMVVTQSAKSQNSIDDGARKSGVVWSNSKQIIEKCTDASATARANKEMGLSDIIAIIERGKDTEAMRGATTRLLSTPTKGICWKTLAHIGNVAIMAPTLTDMAMSSFFVNGWREFVFQYSKDRNLSSI